MSDEPSSLAIALAVAWTLIQLFGCSGAPAVPPEVARAELCIRGAQVFDGERDRGVLDVQVRAGRIAAVGPGLCTAGGDGVVDAAAHTLLPGLIDAHSHNGGDSLVIQAQFGVTTTLDMAARAEWAAERRAEQRSLAAGSDALQRADLLSPGPPATAPGGHGTEYGVLVPTIREPDEVEAWMHDRRQEGADYVKVIYEHGEVIHHPVPDFAARPVAATKALHQAGVPILAGSDAPNRGTAYGASLHHEIELLVRGGLSTASALTAATSAPAKAFGLDDRGKIAVGRRADLLLVRGDALADVRATRRIVGIWKCGVRIARRTAPVAGAGMNAAAVLGAAQASSTAGAAGSTTVEALALAEISVDAVRGGTSAATIQRGDDAGALTTAPKSIDCVAPNA